MEEEIVTKEKKRKMLSTALRFSFITTMVESVIRQRKLTEKEMINDMSH